MKISNIFSVDQTCQRKSKYSKTSKKDKIYPIHQGGCQNLDYYVTIMEKLPRITDNPFGRKKYICGWNVGGGRVRN